MSIRVMSLVWDHAPVADTELTLLLAMADHAHDDGGSIFPSVPTLAKKIRKSVRQTQRLLHDLAGMGLIERTGQLPDHRYIYRIRLENLGGDIAMSPVTRMTPGGDIATAPGGGDIATAPKPSSRNRQEEPSSLAGPAAQRYSHEFESFWGHYGKTNGPKKPAFSAWERLSKADRAAAVLALPAWVDSEQWRRGYKPYPQKYLNQRMWEGDPTTENGHRPGEDLASTAEVEAIKQRARELGGRT